MRDAFHLKVEQLQELKRQHERAIGIVKQQADVEAGWKFRG